MTDIDWVQLRDTAVLGRVENVDAVDLVQVQDHHVSGDASVRGADVEADLVNVGRVPERIPIQARVQILFGKFKFRCIELAHEVGHPSFLWQVNARDHRLRNALPPPAI